MAGILAERIGSVNADQALRPALGARPGRADRGGEGRRDDADVGPSQAGTVPRVGNAGPLWAGTAVMKHKGRSKTVTPSRQSLTSLI